MRVLAPNDTHTLPPARIVRKMKVKYCAGNEGGLGRREALRVPQAYKVQVHAES
jgi:hypothetical protein